MKKVSLFSVLILLTSCTTFSLTNVMVDGQATDVVDGEQKQDSKPSLTVDVPVTP